MRALTVWQPWASLIACGVKNFETRSWAPPQHVVGQRIAIHAAKVDVMRFAPAFSLEFRKKVAEALDLAVHGADWGNLPHAGVLCTAKLSAAHLCGNPNPGEMVYVERSIGQGDMPVLIQGDAFGDFSPGRWAWQLEDVQIFDHPIPATGKQGLWTWEPPTGSRFIPPPMRHIPAPGGVPATVLE